MDVSVTSFKRFPKGRAMHRVYGLRLVSNFGVRPAVDKNFNLRLTVENMDAVAVFTEKYLQPCNSSGINFTADVNCTNPKTEMQTKIIDIQLILIQF